MTARILADSRGFIQKISFFLFPFHGYYNLEHYAIEREFWNFEGGGVETTKNFSCVFDQMRNALNSPVAWLFAQKEIDYSNEEKLGGGGGIIQGIIYNIEHYVMTW